MARKRTRKTKNGNEASVKERGGSPAAVDSVLSSALKQVGLDERVARYNFVLKWPEIAGEEIAGRSRPECIRGKCLVIRVVDSVWAQELSFHKQAILVRLKRHLREGEMIEDVAFVVGEIDDGR